MLTLNPEQSCDISVQSRSCHIFKALIRFDLAVCCSPYCEGIGESPSLSLVQSEQHAGEAGSACKDVHSQLHCRALVPHQVPLLRQHMATTQGDGFAAACHSAR